MEAIMRILVIGIVGQTALQVMRALLANGHEVTALAGPSAYLPDPDPLFRVARGDVRDVRCIESVVKNKDIVISCVGAKALARTDFQDVVMRNLDAAMTKFGVKRLVKLLT
jgi:nucleoside-diphosphate-sugar epimerase